MTQRQHPRPHRPAPITPINRANNNGHHAGNGTGDGEDIPAIVPNIELSDVPMSVYHDDDEDVVIMDTLPEGTETTPAGSRIPIEWLGIIDEIRQAPGTPFPNLFKTRSHFYRWAIQEAIKRARKIIAHYADSPSELISANVFVEEFGGKMAMRADLVLKAHTQVEQMAKALARLISLNEYAEAAKWITQYIQQADKHENQFWRSMFKNTLIENASIAPHLATLVSEGVLVDPVIAQSLAARGLITLQENEPDEM